MSYVVDELTKVTLREHLDAVLAEAEENETMQVNGFINVATKRYLFGVKLDLLPNVCSKKIRDRVSDVRDQAVRMNYFELDTVASVFYDDAYALYNSGVYRYEPKFTGERYNLLKKGAGLLVLTYRYDKVKWEVTTALKSGTSVAVFSPHKDPDMVKLHSVAQWEDLCDMEANPEWAAWRKELPINCTAILKTETPWLGVANLDALAAQFAEFDAFLDYLNAEMHEIEAEGEWDVDVSYSPVYNEKASVSHYVANKGMDKGKRTCSSQYKYGKKEFWYNYEVLPVDIMTKYLHLSYLHSISYKPLQRIASDGADYGTRKYFEFLSESDIEDGQYEQGLTVTPMYADPYFHDVKPFGCDIQWVSPEKLASDALTIWANVLGQLIELK